MIHEQNSSGVDRAIAPLICHAAKTSFRDLPPEVVDACKKSILDCVSATIAGSSAHGVGEVLGQLRSWGGTPESTVAFFGDRLPAHDAAFANVLMSHALELDDAHYPAIVHPTTPTLWPALATAEAMGGCSGRQLIEAVAVGVDLMCRLANAGRNTIDHGYHTALYSVFGAATATAKLRRLSQQQLHNALGIAFAQAAATVQAGVDGALVKRMQPAFSASNGMKAVMFALAGITGVSRILSGQFGLYRLFNHSDCDTELLLDGLGSRFMGSELSIKRYPTSRCSHAAIEGTLELVAAHGVSPDDVAKITVEVQKGCYKREQRPFDPTIGTPQVAAQFSIDYGVAAAILWREVFVDQIQDDAVLDPRVFNLTRKVEIKLNEQEAGITPYLPVNINIHTKRGAVFGKTVRTLRGSPDHPLTWDEVVSERFERCLRYSAVALSGSRVEELPGLISRLEDLDDVRVLLTHLQPAGRAGASH